MNNIVIIYVVMFVSFLGICFYGIKKDNEFRKEKLQLVREGKATLILMEK